MWVIFLDLILTVRKSLLYCTVCNTRSVTIFVFITLFSEFEMTKLNIFGMNYLCFKRSTTYQEMMYTETQLLSNKKRFGVGGRETEISIHPKEAGKTHFNVNSMPIQC